MRVSIALLAVALLAALVLGACSQKHFGATSTAPQLRGPPAADSTPRQADSALAYEHAVSIELAKTAVAARIEEVRRTCNARPELACTLLDVSLNTGREVQRGRIRMRLAPSGVGTMIDIAAKDGKVRSRSTHAEDLAEPIADTDRELSLLSSHRDRLGEFLKRQDLKVDQVISLSKEISSTQTQIDALNTRRANLRRRVDTELLTLELLPPEEAYREESTPITDAIASFGSDFRDAVAQVIRFTAGLLPWLVIIVPGIVLLRVFWRWITRWLVRRDERR